VQHKQVFFNKPKLNRHLQIEERLTLFNVIDVQITDVQMCGWNCFGFIPILVDSSLMQ